MTLYYFFEVRMIHRIATKLFERAIKIWGEATQTFIAIEEMAELTKELIKHLRGRDNKTQITEELADVLICMQSLQYIHRISSYELQAVVNFKLQRFKERCEEAENVIRH